MAETVRVKYQFRTPATLRGEMNVPKEMFDRLAADEAWSDEIEEYISGMHDFARFEPDMDPEFEADFDDIDIIEEAAAE